nr:hypothetical protein Iba_chr04bCG10500 [Ipomoea batatas]GMC82129.1 hypothetical protein Iba_chr04bCG10510 [Ipomoea batatas]GMC88333.1 hypothetical protein Iba_chr04eCG9120 [Ipomoea batatas]
MRRRSSTSDAAAVTASPEDRPGPATVPFPSDPADASIPTKNWVSKNGIFAFGFLEKYVVMMLLDSLDYSRTSASAVDLGSSGCKKMVDLGN